MEVPDFPCSDGYNSWFFLQIQVVIGKPGGISLTEAFELIKKTNHIYFEVI